MKVTQSKIRIVFFIGSLRTGGKERRLLELLTYLKSKGCYEMLVLLTSDLIHYPKFQTLDIPYQILPKVWRRKDPTVVYQFYKYCKKFNPDLIHSWGQMQSFYTLPTVALESIPLINSQITSAPPTTSKFSLSYALDRLIFSMSAVILSNSKAGLTTFQPPKHKSRVIYNGLNLERFENLQNAWDIKKIYGINTRYAVVMVASVSPNKDYNMFVEVGRIVTALRDDITFIGVGGYLEHDPTYQHVLEATNKNPRMLFKGAINEVESLVNACDIGMLLSPNGEGISNAILEYMTLGKPVIASNKGGTPEIIRHDVNGYLLEDHDTAEDIAAYVMELVNDEQKRTAFGEVSRKTIYENFTVEKMGRSFEQVYQLAILKKPAVLRTIPVSKIDNKVLEL
ncbi:glycosyltransferase [Pontibacter sp. FD36]|uniref:glycosyltransferase n=1 Tax=Pontibacter sp. FD36 TaxID=2789860 RepID=UPI0018A99FDE|nr:glycosyltransferase [Pontibacter sp. FD36]MBF8964682.1 glycosyltransferase [Pontibacter sp. FD36]